MKNPRGKIYAELESIRQSHGGRLHPEHVVEFARNPETALYKRFTWDDTDAAQRWRLHQASEIIRVTVAITPRTSETIRPYVSLTSDRKEEGGYRATVDVLSDKELRAQMVADAKAELDAFSRKYAKLSKLRAFSKVFRAIKDVITEKRV